MAVYSESAEREAIRHFLCADRGGFYVEVGANDPQQGSQTWHLEQSGWKGILVEPQRALCERLIQARPAAQVFQAACGRPDQVGQGEIWVPIYGDLEVTSQASLAINVDHASFERHRKESVEIVTLDRLLEKASARAIDFMSIDTEGTELDILQGFSLEKYRPRLILIEDRLVYLDKHRYLQSHGYRLVKRTGFNNWYIPRGAIPPQRSQAERWDLFRKLYLSLVFRKLQECRAMKSLQPLTRL